MDEQATDAEFLRQGQSAESLGQQQSEQKHDALPSTSDEHEESETSDGEHQHALGKQREWNSFLIAVGVDFGTTFTSRFPCLPLTGSASPLLIIESFTSTLGVSFASSSLDYIPFEPGMLLDFRGRWAVPSLIAYGKEMSWGFDVETTSATYCWSKMLIDEQTVTASASESDSAPVNGTGLLVIPHDISAQRMIRDFLREISETVNMFFESRFSRGLATKVPRTYCFPVPAHWPLGTQYDLRDAARAAGFAGDPIYLVSGAESSAIAYLSSNSREIQVGYPPKQAAFGGMLKLRHFPSARKLFNCLRRRRRNHSKYLSSTLSGRYCWQSPVDRSGRSLRRTQSMLYNLSLC